ncbi:MAG: M23 family metallopeptidase [Magnetospirillum sp.]|nr:M23 family metallopeptidase [Magnetospirillum sp.]
MLGAVLPEWQVFIRRPDGRGGHFTFTRRHQTVILGVFAGVSLWALTVTALLMHRPEEVAVKERQLDKVMASYHAAEQRLETAHRLVGDITHEVDAVHSDLMVLAESSAALTGRHADARPAPSPVPSQISVGDPAYDDATQPGGAEAKAVRDEVRRLEASLDRLKVTYGRVVQNTAGVANSRIAQAESLLRHIGADPDRLLAENAKRKGMGGPFIPAAQSALGGDSGLDMLLGRMERWNAIKAVLKNVPLAAPLHQAWEVNSPFGARHDPLNNRTGIHEGLDLGAPYGTPVYATAAGIVKMAGPYDRYGNTVDIDHGNGFLTRYAHLSRIKVTVGQAVSTATVIGLLGNSGRSTGAHLHYEVRMIDVPRDPLTFISAGRDAPEIR